MKTIKQPAGSKLCVAACAAMIAGVSLEDVLDEVTLHPEGWLPLSELLRFLAKRDIMLGMNISLADLEFDDASCFEFNVNLKTSDLPAFVTVQSPVYDQWNHAIVWDNEVGEFRDPWPAEGELSDARGYIFRQWLPFYKLELYS